jgi:hypothetical protein
MKGMAVTAKTNGRTRVILAVAGALVAAFAVMATGCAASLHPVQIAPGGGSGFTSN